MPSLELRNVSKFYGSVVALENVNLSVRNKEYVCLLGPSGCGKSTLIKCVAGIIRPDKGDVLIDGRAVGPTLIEDRKIGYVFQEIALFPHMTVRDNVSYGLMVRETPLSRVATVTNEMLDLINMRERSRSYSRELSGGAQQKVAVARAIATGSSLFLLDEPLGALDALVRGELRYELKRLAADLGLTIVHVTHDQEEALSIADRVVVMKGGRIVEAGNPLDIYMNPKTVFTENFVGETNLLEGTVLDTDGKICSVEVKHARVYAYSSRHKPGDRVVVSVRPEFVHVLPLESSPGDEWAGKIKQATFLGASIRYTVELDSGVHIIAQIPSTSDVEEFHVGDTVSASLNQVEHILLFDYPKEGLEKETALE